MPGRRTPGSKGKEIIRRIFQMKESLKDEIKIAYLENYDMELGKLITSGVDLWLNTPRPPLEASGTSGMKAALNGVPLSVYWTVGGSRDISMASRGGPSEKSSGARVTRPIRRKMRSPLHKT